MATAAGVLVAAQILGRRDLLTLALLLALLPTAAALSHLLFRPGFDVERVPAPDVVEAGQAAEVALSVRHSSLLGGRMAMAEQLPPSLGSGPAFLYPGRSVGPDGESRYRYQLSCPRRGLYVLGPVEAKHTDPFGLAERHSRVGPGTPLTVTPAAVPLPVSTLTGLRGAEGLVATRVQSTPSDDDVMTREYRHGDPMRRVHWAATARHGELMVRQEESATSPEATVVLDLRPSAFPRPGHEPAGDEPESPAFEWAVTAAMSVAAHLGELDYTVRLLDAAGTLALSHSPSSPEPDAPSYSGRDGLGLIAEGLAAIRPHRQTDRSQTERSHTERSHTERSHTAGAGWDRIGELLLDRLEGHRRRGPIVAILGRTTPEAAAVLAPAVDFAERALAVVVTSRPGVSAAAVETLRDAGWRAVEASPRSSVAAVWAALTEDTATGSAATGSSGRGSTARGNTARGNTARGNTARGSAAQSSTVDGKTAAS